MPEFNASQARLADARGAAAAAAAASAAANQLQRQLARQLALLSRSVSPDDPGAQPRKAALEKQLSQATADAHAKLAVAQDAKEAVIAALEAFASSVAENVSSKVSTEQSSG